MAESNHSIALIPGDGIGLNTRIVGAAVTSVTNKIRLADPAGF